MEDCWLGDSDRAELGEVFEVAANLRPGGLTALATCNFVLGAFSVLAMLYLAALPFIDRSSLSLSPDQRQRFDTLLEIGTPRYTLLILSGLVVALWLIVVGVGYLRLKKFMGRKLGNVWAVVSIVATIPWVVWMPAELGGGLNMGQLINLLYPVLTLVLLNTAFKDDFVN